MRAVSAHGDEQRACVSGIRAGVVWVGGRAACVCGWWRWCRGRGEVWAAYDAELNARVDEQREADGVLPAAQEPLRPVDRIERPHAYNHTTSYKTAHA